MTAVDARAHFTALAAYNAWANDRLYADAAQLSPENRVRPAGVYFNTLFDTLAHILETDSAWLHLLRGGGMADLPPAETFANLDALHRARRAQDARLAAWIAELPRTGFDEPFVFTSGLGDWKGLSHVTTKAGILTHLFNHQTHHRGQAHAALTRLGVAEPRSLDIIVKGLLGE